MDVLTRGRPTRRLWRMHGLLAVQSLVVVLVSVNRLSTLTLGYVAPNEFLRWVDLNNLLVVPLISVAALYLLKKHLEYEEPTHRGGWHLALSLAFFVGIYGLGASYGVHEVTNYLHTRFCAAGAEIEPRLCQIVIFNDDVFSHGVFFGSYVLINGALMLIQTLFPHPEPLLRGDYALLGLNGLFIALGIFANLAFERIGFDLYVVAFLALLACGLLRRHGAQPLLVYYAMAYGLGLAATMLYKAVA